jgi:hypothetical protein
MASRKDNGDALLDRRDLLRGARLENIQFLQAGPGAGGDSDETSFTGHCSCRELPDREATLKEIFDALKPGGMLSVTEIVLDPHFQRQQTVIRLAEAAGFQKKAIYGSRGIHVDSGKARARARGDIRDTPTRGRIEIVSKGSLAQATLAAHSARACES